MWHGYYLLESLTPYTSEVKTTIQSTGINNGSELVHLRNQTRYSLDGTKALVEVSLDSQPTATDFAVLVGTTFTRFSGETWEEMRANAASYIASNATAWEGN